MRTNPGGQLAPNEVIGRDEFIENLWRILERQSLVLASERRMGKTQIVRKMCEQPRPNWLPVYRDLEHLQHPIDFVEAVAEDVFKFLSKTQKAAKRFNEFRSAFGGGEVAGFKIPESAAQRWQPALESLLEDLAESQSSKRLLFVWDEIPLMLDNIKRNHGEQVAMEMLDTLRALRHRFPSLRMIFTGSIGLHHVLSALKKTGYANRPTNDMHHEELEPLLLAHAVSLATQLMEGEGITPSEIQLTAEAIAFNAGRVPFYVHHLVDELARSKAAATPEEVAAIAERRIRDPQDPWDLEFFIDRVSTYYADDTQLAYSVLDLLAAEPSGMKLADLYQAIKARQTLTEPEPLRRILTLLQRDHYLGLGESGEFSFRLRVVRRAWAIRREELL